MTENSKLVTRVIFVPEGSTFRFVIHVNKRRRLISRHALIKRQVRVLVEFATHITWLTSVRCSVKFKVRNQNIETCDNVG